MATLSAPKDLDERHKRRCSDAEADRRIDAKLAQFPTLGELQQQVPESPKAYRSQVMLPTGPFQAWIALLVAQERASGARDPIKAVARRCRVSHRRIDEFLHGRVKSVDEATVERYCTHDGSVEFGELYPHGPDTAWLSIYYWQPKEASLARCATPKCSEQCREGSRFCAKCADRLAAIRAEYKAESEAFSARIGRKGPPRCCNRLCSNPRDGLRTERFCTECQAAGYHEGMYE